MPSIAKKLMGLFKNYSGRLRVHEANAEVTVEIGGRPDPDHRGELAEPQALRPPAVHHGQERALEPQEKALEPTDDLLPPGRVAPGRDGCDGNPLELSRGVRVEKSFRT